MTKFISDFSPVGETRSCLRDLTLTEMSDGFIVFSKESGIPSFLRGSPVTVSQIASLAMSTRPDVLTSSSGSAEPQLLAASLEGVTRCSEVLSWSHCILRLSGVLKDRDESAFASVVLGMLSGFAALILGTTVGYSIFSACKIHKASRKIASLNSLISDISGKIMQTEGKDRESLATKLYLTFAMDAARNTISAYQKYRASYIYMFAVNILATLALFTLVAGIVLAVVASPLLTIPMICCLGIGSGVLCVSIVGIMLSSVREAQQKRLCAFDVQRSTLSLMLSEWFNRRSGSSEIIRCKELSEVSRSILYGYGDFFSREEKNALLSFIDSFSDHPGVFSPPPPSGQPTIPTAPPLVEVNSTFSGYPPPPPYTP
ncbi:hypothetical protein CP10139811_0162 [Chlamydia ibidis]|uniref:Uncharacterized protein n=2 Tax=Chlamydia ibidis TaxID=1405396 RepID=S7J540_9CHLA|nr:hypothetical protein [Chlamydia ibidis]EPP35318.1 hypothetical protein CP10139811_0162 [Chlamydia ibidis]EQM62756.1 hypothetical protein H359_0604 [Chlamydia ibidis 10-1398/6]